MNRPGRVLATSLFVIAIGSLQAPPAAMAHSVGDVVTVGTSQTPGTPSSPYVSDKLSGSWDPRNWLTLRLDATFTYDLPGAPPPLPSGKQSGFPTSAGKIFLFNAGADFMPNDHWTLSLDLNGSPRSAITQDNQYPPLMGSRLLFDVNERVTSASIGGIVSAAYDTGGDHRIESSVDASVSFNWVDTEDLVLQQILLDAKGNPVSQQQIQRELQNCAARQTTAMPCSRKLVQALNYEAQNIRGKASLPSANGSVGQFTFLGGITETLFHDTDIGVSGSYYVYTSDPTLVLSANTTLGKSAVGGGLHVVNRDFGTGVALSPYWWTVRPELAQRFGGLSIGASYQYGQYVDNADYAYNMTVGVKLSYKHKFERYRIKVWLGATGQRDVDKTGAATLGGMAAAGVKITF